MHAIVITESYFGNTAAVAQAITEGLREQGADVKTSLASDAPLSIDTDLIVVAAPTHNMGLPTPATREQAADKGATVASSNGVREWLDSITSIRGTVIATSTTTGGFMAGSAAKATVKALKRKKINADRGEDFVVAATPGPLKDGEVDRAKNWARTLRS